MYKYLTMVNNPNIFATNHMASPSCIMVRGQMIWFKLQY